MDHIQVKIMFKYLVSTLTATNWNRVQEVSRILGDPCHADYQPFNLWVQEGTGGRCLRKVTGQQGGHSG